MLTLIDLFGTLPIAVALCAMLVLAGACEVKLVKELRKL
jgi:hypothetical protein